MLQSVNLGHILVNIMILEFQNTKHFQFTFHEKYIHICNI